MKSTLASTSIAGSSKAGPARLAWPVAIGALVAVVALGLAGARAQVQLPEYRYGIKVELVSLFATVQDRSGKLVRGLGRDDFVIYDDGVPQKISQFSAEYIPLSVLILLDCSSSMRGKKLEYAKRALGHFLDRLRPSDEAMLVTFQTKPRVVQGYTDRFDSIRRALKKLDGNGSTALYDAIAAALDESRRAQNRRKSLLLISDGINNYGNARLADTVVRLQRSGLELFAIGLESNLPEDMEERAVTRAVLDQLSRAAGGEAFVVSDAHDLGRICSTISDRMHNQYAFAYYPPPSPEGRWHPVRVETRVPGLRVIPSKKGYFPGPAAEVHPE